MKYKIFYCGEKLDVNNKPRIWGVFNIHEIDEYGYVFDIKNYVFFGTPQSLVIKKVNYTYRRIGKKKKYYKSTSIEDMLTKFPEIKANIEQFVLMEMLK